jgi:hypothetical protein
MNSVIKIVSAIIILLGIVHITFAFPIHMNEGTLWFIGSGMCVIFAGLLNFVAIDGGGTRFSKSVALLVNAINCGLFIFALPILGEPQVYVGVIVFAITTIAFLVLLTTAFPD